MPAFETRTDSLGRLQKYPKIHVSTGEQSSSSGPDSTQGLRPRHRRERNPERPPRNSHGDWPFLRPPERVPEVPVGKNSRRSSRISRAGTLHRKGERNSRVVPPFQESPRCVSPFQRNLFSLHCLTFKPRIDSHHVCTRDSTVGKRKCMPAFETRTDSPGETPEVPQDPYQYWRGILGSGPDSTQGLRPRHQRERNPERPPRNSHGDWPFLRPQERVPEVPVRLLLRCDGNNGNSFPTKQGKDPSSRARRRKRGSPGWVRDPRASSRVETGALDLRRGPQGPALVATGKTSPHASSSGASRDSSPVDART
ncbi:hypothetical protein MJT46_009829 [Ovis ammon polii x Ovis aries]|nr:hypothetical protein MJT46_009829 [Ovis ammon polii x Ovis aries]